MHVGPCAVLCECAEGTVVKYCVIAVSLCSLNFAVGISSVLYVVNRTGRAHPAHVLFVAGVARAAAIHKSAKVTRVRVLNIPRSGTDVV